jgi:hypothetical protein
MKRKIVSLLWLCTALLSAAEKKPPIEEASNELVDISATVLLDKDQIHQALGMDMGDDEIVVVRATVRPVSDKPIQLSADNFLLISNKDGQRSEPFAPGQIAGSEALAVSPAGKKGGFTHNRPSFGGVVGIGGGGVGNSGSTPSNDVKVEATHEDKPNPLLGALKEKALPEKEITETASGLLYFQIVGKVKSKDLELRYKGPGGRLVLRFRP